MAKAKREEQIVHTMKRLVDLSEGVFSYGVDLSLWFVAYAASMGMPQSSVGQVYWARATADRLLDEINYETIKRGIAEARRRGFLKKTVRGKRAWPEITEAGKKRLASVIPQYDTKRVWDGRMHLVTYDIPETKRKDRFLLRMYLRRIGCARLQDSVWITPYNPIDILRAFIEEKVLSGTIIVSDMGKDGSIGDEDIRALVVRVYGLELLNNRYKEWLDNFEGNAVQHWLIIKYFSILRDDPQLPFTLLPQWWKGDEVYEKLRKLKRIGFI